MQLFINNPHKFEMMVTDDNGDFVSGLAVLYEIRKCSNNTVVVSGMMSEVGSVYTFEYTFTDMDEYRVKYITPSTYENGFESVIVRDEIDKKIREVYEVMGLDATKPLVVNRTSRISGTIRQSIAGTDEEVTIRRL